MPSGTRPAYAGAVHSYVPGGPMLSALSLALAALSAPLAATSPPAPNELIARWVRNTDADRPRVNVWLNRDDVYNRGDQARVYFKSDRDAYVTIVRIDTDGRLR